MALHTLIFDADGVLYSRTQPIRYLHEYLQSYGIEPRHPVVVQRALKAAYFDVLHGRITREAFYEAMLRFQGLEDERAIAEGRAAIMADAADIEPTPDAVEIVSELYDHGYRMVVVSNTEHRAADLAFWLSEIGFSPNWWLGVFTSAEMRLTSPDPQFFSTILNATNSHWSEVAYIINQERQLGALMEHGMKTIGFRLQPHDNFHVHHTIQSFPDLADLLFKLNDYGDTLLHGDR